MLIVDELDGCAVTHTAGAYTLLDPTSPIFMRDDTIFCPTYVPRRASSRAYSLAAWHSCAILLLVLHPVVLASLRTESEIAQKS